MSSSLHSAQGHTLQIPLCSFLNLDDLLLGCLNKYTFCWLQRLNESDRQSRCQSLDFCGGQVHFSSWLQDHGEVSNDGLIVSVFQAQPQTTGRDVVWSDFHWNLIWTGGGTLLNRRNESFLVQVQCNQQMQTGEGNGCGGDMHICAIFNVSTQVGQMNQRHCCNEGELNRLFRFFSGL